MILERVGLPTYPLHRRVRRHERHLGGVVRRRGPRDPDRTDRRPRLPGHPMNRAHRPERAVLGIPTWAWAIALPAGTAIALIAWALVSSVLTIGGPAA